MSLGYFWRQNDIQVGPLSARELKSLVASGKLHPTDWVWKQGFPGWVPAAKLKGLFPPLPRSAPTTDRLASAVAPPRMVEPATKSGGRSRWLVFGSVSAAGLIGVLLLGGSLWLLAWGSGYFEGKAPPVKGAGPVLASSSANDERGHNGTTGDRETAAPVATSFSGQGQTVDQTVGGSGGKSQGHAGKGIDKERALASLRQAEARYLEAKALYEADQARYEQASRFASQQAGRFGAMGVKLPPVPPPDPQLARQLEMARLAYEQAKKAFEQFP
jgi:GYF domain 2